MNFLVVSVLDLPVISSYIASTVCRVKREKLTLTDTEEKVENKSELGRRRKGAYV